MVELLSRQPQGRLAELAELYDERNALYGDNYKHFGPIMHYLFPDGLYINSAVDWNRIGIFVQITAKLTRYAAQFTKGGHTDSLDDAAVYAMMLQELDMEAAEAKADDTPF